jgi:aldose 1-epimerase
MLLTNGGIELEILPQLAGGVIKFRAQGIDIFRPWDGEHHSPLALSNFALVPFSGRIANGHFVANGENINLPATVNVDPQNAIHGHGWQMPWQVVDQSEGSLHLRYEHSADSWPWPYRSEQIFTVTPSGYIHELSVQNLGSTPMPAGLGLHPYFPRQGASIETKFSGKWHVGPDQIPDRLETISGDVDWFGGPLIDHGFERDDNGPILLRWPTHLLTITPQDDLPHTVIYVPSGEDYFCVEPVSHVANAINTGGMRWLSPSEAWTTSADFSVSLD